MAPAQDPNSPLGKTLRLTLDGKPAPDNPMAGQVGAKTRPLIDPARDTEAAKTAPVVSTYTVEGPNLAQAETWSTGHRTPYGLAFAPLKQGGHVDATLKFRAAGEVKVDFAVAGIGAMTGDSGDGAHDAMPGMSHDSMPGMKMNH